MSNQATTSYDASTSKIITAATKTSEENPLSNEDEPSSSLSSSQSSSNPCDRRLSRAARNILIHDILPILQHHHPDYSDRHHSTVTHSSNPNNRINNMSNNVIIRQIKQIQSTHDLYSTLLTDLLSVDVDENGTCLLHPRHDMHFQDERNYSASLSRYNSRRQNISLGKLGREKNRLHICWMCQKTFASRYYLDRHLEEGTCRRRHHGKAPTEVEHDKSSTMEVCPARDLCHHLGERRCQHRALIDEPYYARGHPNDPATRRTHQRSTTFIHPDSCDENDMAVRRAECRRSLGTSCFSMDDKPELVRDITTVLCDETWDCRRAGRDLHRDVRGVDGDGVFHQHHHHVVGAGRHQRREEWYIEHDKVAASPGLLITFLVVTSLLHYIMYGDFGDKVEKYD